MNPIRSCLLLTAVVLLGTGPGCGRKKQRVEPATVPDWGVVYDPDGGCTVTPDGGRLTLTVPGGNRNLNPGMNMTAPRVLRAVEGDFVASVRVTGEFDPGEGGVDVPPFNGAGLVVWQDERNYVRVERNRYWVPSAGRHYCYPLLVEYYRDGVYQNTNPQPAVSGPELRGGSTYLRVERTGRRLEALASADGREWVRLQEISVDLPPRLHVGVDAVNTSQRPFTVVFDEFRLGPGR